MNEWPRRVRRVARGSACCAGSWSALAFALTALIGIWVYDRIELLWCGRASLRDSACFLPEEVGTTVIAIFVALAAVTTLTAAWMMAPRRTLGVLWSLYALGALAALVASDFGKDALNLAAALVAGVVTAVVLGKLTARTSRS
ncbi:MAG TPA: hypothetical protein VLC09_06850 [Polyangiaceae bacterium]|nr:hypothetical protein [Polyangiaceae bacterium]